MPKSVPPSDFTVADSTFATNAMPDPFDERDFVYRPRLDPLPHRIEPPTGPDRYVLRQEGESCTGHALATMINAALAKERATGTRPDRVSPYMLYYFARRYDEYPGERDEGSSLRAALKGWFNHGVCTESWWNPRKVPDVNDSKFVRHCRERPLGAFYRVHCFRLDDMQSAISELHAVVASAQIHDGWKQPEVWVKDGRKTYVIRRPVSPRKLTGHAFAIVGYNDIGFVVQNSWGRDWGDGGFAMLTYEDWLDSAYDAWVVRHGVPHTPFVTGRRRDEEATNSILATGVGPDRRRLDRHVVKLDADGSLSSIGEFVSTPKQLQRVVSRMEEWHEGWAQRPLIDDTGKEIQVQRHVVLYVHGGLLSDSESLEAAHRHLNWWLNNRIYPIYLAWDAGPAKELLTELDDRMSGRMPEGGVGFDLVEQFDRLVELTARQKCRWMWDQLEQNARAVADASDESKGADGIGQLLDRLGKYAARYPGKCAMHLVGHGAGAIVLAALLPHLRRRKLPVSSLNLLAPALAVDDFERLVLRRLPAGWLEQLTVFGLSPQRELDDTCAVGDTPFYQKSLLYLISRGLERSATGAGSPGEVPLLGMAKYFTDPELQTRIRRKCPATFITAPTAAPKKCRTDAVRHADFEDDSFTLTSLAIQLLGITKVEPFRSSAPLLGLDLLPDERPPGRRPAAVADTQSPDAPPVATTAEASPFAPRIPECRSGEVPPEIGEAPPDGTRTTPALEMAGYELPAAARRKRPTRRRTHA